MKLTARIGMVAATGALAVAGPAVAKTSHAGKPPHPSKPVTSHKCTPQKVAYVASGTVVTWAATQNSNGTWTGTIAVHVTRANHHGNAAEGSDLTYTLTTARVHLGHGVGNPPSAGDRVQVMGKTTALAKKCNQSGFAPAITIKRADVHTAHNA